MLYRVFADPIGRNGGDGVRFINGEIDWFAVDSAAAGSVNHLLHVVFDATLNKTN